LEILRGRELHWRTASPQRKVELAQRKIIPQATYEKVKDQIIAKQK
jgi:hypothetical protein